MQQATAIQLRRTADIDNIESEGRYASTPVYPYPIARGHSYTAASSCHFTPPCNITAPNPLSYTPRNQ